MKVKKCWILDGLFCSDFYPLIRLRMHSHAEAWERENQSIKNIKWNNAYYRTDIGYRAIERGNN
ncbi:MAG: hypothetical protein QS748_07720 [Candidatus Endonucleobacter bathymodioli]|uniref:Uncharacterized protein n=1 Tax=Candidatus Endonucleibacter bathymodioli TaxID=539814 RepID=A0AA90SDA8_9GAMM|nr:hypothetical protein [Candidatus Endonucleobacter bathymodioli]